jgi:hypothetical protein
MPGGGGGGPGRLRRPTSMKSISTNWLAIGLIAATIAVVGCSPIGSSGPLSDTGQAIMIVIAHQPIYAQPDCTGETGVMVSAGSNVIDLGTVGTNCEQVVYPAQSNYSGIGYMPVYGMRRAAGGVRCRATVDCHLRAGPGTSFGVVGAIPPGGPAAGYGTSRTNAIITDGNNYDWWEVVDPTSGQRADIFGPNCQAF